MKKPVLLTLFILVSALAYAAPALHLMGGANQDVYLGCYNCNRFDSNSIWNEFGTYGSPFGSNSIWNQVGTYGSTVSNNSPWNTVANKPPVLVDASGNFYGYLTVNTVMPQRANSSLASTMYEYYKFIREDVSKWYDKIFG